MDAITLEDKKKELLAWLNETNDAAAIEKLYAEKEKLTFDFDKEFEKGYTAEEVSNLVSEKISRYPWKK